MTGYTIAYDEGQGVLVSRVHADFPMDTFNDFCAALRVAVAAARCRGPLRFLSDNRAHVVFGQQRSELLWQILHLQPDPADRIALLVADSLAKIRARDQAGMRAQPFASENAAYTWLGAGASLAA